MGVLHEGEVFAHHDVELGKGPGVLRREPIREPHGALFPTALFDEQLPLDVVVPRVAGAQDLPQRMQVGDRRVARHRIDESAPRRRDRFRDRNRRLGERRLVLRERLGERVRELLRRPGIHQRREGPALDGDRGLHLPRIEERPGVGVEDQRVFSPFLESEAGKLERGGEPRVVPILVNHQIPRDTVEELHAERAIGGGEIQLERLPRGGEHGVDVRRPARRFHLAHQLADPRRVRAVHPSRPLEVPRSRQHRLHHFLQLLARIAAPHQAPLAVHEERVGQRVDREGIEPPVGGDSRGVARDREPQLAGPRIEERPQCRRRLLGDRDAAQARIEVTGLQFRAPRQLQEAGGAPARGELDEEDESVPFRGEGDRFAAHPLLHLQRGRGGADRRRVLGGGHGGEEEGEDEGEGLHERRDRGVGGGARPRDERLRERTPPPDPSAQPIAGISTLRESSTIAGPLPGAAGGRRDAIPTFSFPLRDRRSSVSRSGPPSRTRPCAAFISCPT